GAAPPPPPVTVNEVALVPVPLPVDTEIGPDVAPEGTVAVIFVDELTVYDVAAVVLNLTAVTPVKLVPLMVTLAPTAPRVGENDVTVGALPPPPPPPPAAKAVVPFGVPRPVGPSYPTMPVHKYEPLQEPFVPEVTSNSDDVCAYGYDDG